MIIDDISRSLGIKKTKIEINQWQDEHFKSIIDIRPKNEV